VTSVAKQPDLASQSYGFENVDSDIQLLIHQNEWVRYLVKRDKGKGKVVPVL
jgi:hypothetical protein